MSRPARGCSTSTEETTVEVDTIDVWRASLDVGAEREARLRASLSAAERARAARMRRARDRSRAAISRGLLRQCLARYVGVAPRALELREGAHGKPYLHGRHGDVCPSFNLSHSGSLLIIAVASRGQVGVDVERVGALDDGDRISRFFSPAEHAALAALAPQARRAASYRCWTRKEAYAKARGLGLSIDLRDFDVSVTGAAAVLATRGNETHASPIALIDLAVPPGFVAALACVGAQPCVRERAFD